jgi:hypothetical protein
MDCFPEDLSIAGKSRKVGKSIYSRKEAFLREESHKVEKSEGTSFISR